MLEQDLSKFAVLIVSIGEVYGKSFTMAMVDIYWNVLKNFKLEEIQGALYRHLKNPDIGRFVPRPADIILAIEGNSQHQALQAWTKVVSAIHQVGCYNSIAFDDALIHTVIEDMGKWQKLCITSTKQLPFIAKEFQERYRGYVIRKPTRHPRYFIGIIERGNSSFVYRCDPLVLFGDKEKAKQVIITGSSISVTNMLLLSSSSKILTKN